LHGDKYCAIIRTMRPWAVPPSRRSENRHQWRPRN